MQHCFLCSGELHRAVFRGLPFILTAVLASGPSIIFWWEVFGSLVFRGYSWLYDPELLFLELLGDHMLTTDWIWAIHIHSKCLTPVLYLLFIILVFLRESQVYLIKLDTLVIILQQTLGLGKKYKPTIHLWLGNHLSGPKLDFPGSWVTVTL